MFYTKEYDTITFGINEQWDNMEARKRRKKKHNSTIHILPYMFSSLFFLLFFKFCVPVNKSLK